MRVGSPCAPTHFSGALVALGVGGRDWRPGAHDLPPRWVTERALLLLGQCAGLSAGLRPLQGTDDIDPRQS